MNFYILTVVTVLLAGLAINHAVRNRRQADMPSAPGAEVFPDMDINRIAALNIDDTRSRTTLFRVNGRWQVKEKHGYAADFAKLRGFLTKLDGLRVGRPLHLDENLRRELLLSGAARTGADMPSGIQVVFSDDEGKPKATITLGKYFYGEPTPQSRAVAFQWHQADGRYIATHHGAAFLVSETFDNISADPGDWIDPRFLDIPVHALVEIKLVDTDATSLVFEREKPGAEWLIRDAADGVTPDAARIEEFNGVLRRLTFDDIADPSLTDNDLGLCATNAVTINLSAIDGRRYELRIGAPIVEELDGYYSLRAASSFELSSRTQVLNGADTPSDLTETLHRHVETTRAERERISGWTYLIEAGKAETLLQLQAFRP